MIQRASCLTNRRLQPCGASEFASREAGIYHKQRSLQGPFKELLKDSAKIALTSQLAERFTCLAFAECGGVLVQPRHSFRQARHLGHAKLVACADQRSILSWLD